MKRLFLFHLLLYMAPKKGPKKDGTRGRNSSTRGKEKSRLMQKMVGSSFAAAARPFSQLSGKGSRDGNRAQGSRPTPRRRRKRRDRLPSLLLTHTHTHTHTHTPRVLYTGGGDGAYVCAPMRRRRIPKTSSPSPSPNGAIRRLLRVHRPEKRERPSRPSCLHSPPASSSSLLPPHFFPPFPTPRAAGANSDAEKEEEEEEEEEEEDEPPVFLYFAKGAELAKDVAAGAIFKANSEHWLEGMSASSTILIFIFPSIKLANYLLRALRR